MASRGAMAKNTFAIAVAAMPMQISVCPGTRWMTLATSTLQSSPDTQQGMKRSMAPIVPVICTC